MIGASTEPHDHDDGQAAHGGHGGHGGHGWMMIACCIPMMAIAIFLVATGVASPGFLFTALACTVMMALMMKFMNHDMSARSNRPDLGQSVDHEHHPSV